MRNGKRRSFMWWGYRIGEGKQPSPIKFNIESHCHFLLVGGSGSGKSYALLYIVGKILQEYPDIDLTIIDFKNEDWCFLQGYKKAYFGNDAPAGILSYYEKFCNDRQAGNRGQRHLLIADEYPSMILYLSNRDKLEKTKKAVEIQNAIGEILMLGRGIGFGVGIICQRSDAAWFPNGSRDNFHILTALGRISTEQKTMLFAGETLNNKVFQRGEGVVLGDGYPVTEVKFPKISNVVDWKKHIREVLLNQQNKQ